MAKGGFSKYHWYGLVIPLLAAVSPMWLSLIPRPKFISQPIFAVLAGALVAAVTYVLLRFVPYLNETTHTLGKAILLGALATEVLIFHGSTSTPSMTNITLYLFFYFNTIEFLDKNHS